MTANAPIKLPAMEPMRPWSADSIKKISIMNRLRAPKHFIVPISRLLSFTDINIALVIPTTHTNRERLTSQILRASESEAVANRSIRIASGPFLINALLIRLLVKMELKNATPRKTLEETMIALPKRIRILRTLILNASFLGRTTCLLIELAIFDYKTDYTPLGKVLQI